MSDVTFDTCTCGSVVVSSAQSVTDEIARLRNDLHLAQEWSAQVIAGQEQDIAEITRLRALNAELVEALKAELADHEEAIAHDRGGLDYASLVGIPLSNADSLAQSVQYHERRAGFIRAALAKAERETRTAAMDALIKTDGELL